MVEKPCVKCQHSKKDLDSIYYCFSPNVLEETIVLYTDLVTGEIITRLNRIPNSCLSARTTSDFCGPDGKWFEPIEPNFIKRLWNKLCL